jgi:hypothetical protein
MMEKLIPNPIRVIIPTISLVLFSLFSWAVPGTINYQGTLLNNQGIPVTQTSAPVTVSIWDDETSTNVSNRVYTEDHTVDIDDGVFSLEIGGGTTSDPFGPDLFNTGSTLWLEITVNGEVLTPRQPWRSNPYTMQAQNSQLLGNNPPSYFATATDIQNLQDQIDKLQCESGGDYWTGSSCVPGLSVLPYNGDYIPVAQAYLYIATPDNCPEDHYHSYGPVEDCSFNSYSQDPDPNACGFGIEPEVIIIEKATCANPNPNPG